MILAIGAGALLALAVGGAIVVYIASKRFEPAARKWIEAAIESRYQSGVEIGAFHASLSPVPKATIEDIVLRYHHRTDIPPLARIKKMTVEATLAGIRLKPVRILKLTLEGLEVSIPPRTHNTVAASPPVWQEAPEKKTVPAFELEEVVADGMVLHLIPADPQKDPRDFEFATLSLHSVGIDRPMAFTARLTNWKPPGRIETTGQFGPWAAGDPGETPLSGKYTFREADLSVFKGIAGTLSSDGEYRGRLDWIECQGTTDTPDFSVSTGKPVDLKTEFHAIVDGLNGDTTLDPVTAHFLKSTVVARGGVIGMKPRKGKDINLTVTVDSGHVEDFLHLVVKSQQPVMTGPITVRASFDLQPGPREVIDRLNLKGHLVIPNGHFTSLKVQDMLGNFSRRAEGDPKGEIDQHVASQFSSDFTLSNAMMNFSRLVFDVPGAEVRLSGDYEVHGGQMDFTGQARTVAKVSQMTTGFKSKLLKIVDPFFAKDGAGAVIPIRITGTKDSPKFGLNFHNSKK